MNFLTVVLATASLCLPLSQQRSETYNKPGITEFTKVERMGEPNPRYFFPFETSVRHYIIRQDGWGETYSESFGRKKFDLQLGFPGRLERVYFMEAQGDLFLIYEVRDGKSGWGYVERFNQRTRKVMWLTPVSSFNIGSGMVEGSTLFLTTADLIARLDLQTGKIGWQKDVRHLAGDIPSSLSIKEKSVVVNNPDGSMMEVEKETGNVLNPANEKL